MNRLLLEAIRTNLAEDPEKKKVRLMRKKQDRDLARVGVPSKDKPEPRPSRSKAAGGSAERAAPGKMLPVSPAAMHPQGAHNEGILRGQAASGPQDLGRPPVVGQDPSILLRKRQAVADHVDRITNAVDAIGRKWTRAGKKGLADPSMLMRNAGKLRGMM